MQEKTLQIMESTVRATMGLSMTWQYPPYRYLTDLPWDIRQAMWIEERGDIFNLDWLIPERPLCLYSRVGHMSIFSSQRERMPFCSTSDRL